MGKRTETIRKAYEWLKQDLVLLQVKYELDGTNSGDRSNISYPEYDRLRQLLPMVSDLGDLLRYYENKGRRHNVQQVFIERRKKA